MTAACYTIINSLFDVALKCSSSADCFCIIYIIKIVVIADVIFVVVVNAITVAAVMLLSVVEDNMYVQNIAAVTGNFLFYQFTIAVLRCDVMAVCVPISLLLL